MLSEKGCYKTIPVLKFPFFMKKTVKNWKAIYQNVLRGFWKKKRGVSKRIELGL